MSLFPDFTLAAAILWAVTAAYEPNFSTVGVAAALALTGWLGDYIRHRRLLTVERRSGL